MSEFLPTYLPIYLYILWMLENGEVGRWERWEGRVNDFFYMLDLDLDLDLELELSFLKQ